MSFTRAAELSLLVLALLPVVGVPLLCWGLWGDRSKGRARCPKCWYDMRGSLPRLECPECGHDARQERRLYRNRRRWLRVRLGVVLVLLCIYPLTVIGGWYREQAVVRAWPATPTRPGFGYGCIGPDWLVDHLPGGSARFFWRRVHVYGVRSDEALALCGKLRYLQRVHADGGQVTDAGLVHLKGLSRLESLAIGDTAVTDAGVVELQQALPNVAVYR